MKFEKFETGNHFSIGIELELRILDKFTLSPKDEFDYFYSNLDEKFKPNIAKEFLGSMIEINTPIFHCEKDLIEYLKNIISELSLLASKKSLCLQTSGTYAQKSEEFNVSNNKRYEKIYDEHKILLDDFSICGTHVHIGFENFDKALKAYNYSIYYLPLFLALSASSLYYNGIDTGIHSYRTKIFSRLPKASIPEYFDNYEQMNHLYQLLKKSNVIDSTKDIWWDVRIQPHFKTVEFRICDAVNDFERLELIIKLFRVMCQLSQFFDFEKIPMQILKQNMWSATRYSMDGQIVDANGKVKKIRDELKDLLNKAFSKNLIDKSFLEKAKTLIEKESISKKMENLYKRTNSLKEVERLGVFE